MCFNGFLYAFWHHMYVHSVPIGCFCNSSWPHNHLSHDRLRSDVLLVSASFVGQLVELCGYVRRHTAQHFFFLHYSSYKENTSRATMERMSWLVGVGGWLGGWAGEEMGSEPGWNARVSDCNSCSQVQKTSFSSSPSPSPSPYLSRSLSFSSPSPSPYLYPPSSLPVSFPSVSPSHMRYRTCRAGN